MRWMFRGLITFEDREMSDGTGEAEDAPASMNVVT